MKHKSGLLVLLVLMLIANAAAGSKRQTATVYLPVETSNVMPFYINGVPIGAVKVDSAFVMVSLEPVNVGKTEYMRLWLLYENNTNSQYLLEPLKVVSLTLRWNDQSCDRIVPESPTRISERIDNEKARQMILQVIGGALQSFSTQPTRITSPSREEWTVNDKGEKARTVQDRTEAGMANTAMFYEVFRNSINAGILRRNTVFPRQSVNGYIYFLWASLPPPTTGVIRVDGRYKKVDLGGEWRRVGKTYVKTPRVDASNYKYVLNIEAQGDIQVIEFAPVEGE